MTLYTHRVAFMAPLAQVAACNRAANALGRSGVNFTVRLSATGQEPASHLGGSTVETDAFLAALAAAPGLPAGVGWPPELSAPDWQAVADHLVVSLAATAATSPRTQFDALAAAVGLQPITPLIG